jgi:hypothetical protein
MSKKTSPAQLFARIFATFMDTNAPQAERDVAATKMDAWLKRHGKGRADIPSILAQAVNDDAAAQPPPPPCDPRDAAPNPFDDPQFTPAGLVEGIVAKYVTMSEHARVITALWTPFTHVYTQFGIAPRIALVSEEPDSGKSTLRKVLKPLVYRPNREVLGTPAAIARFLAQGAGTLMLDELDHLDAEARKRLQLIWNLGHERGAEISLVMGGRETYFGIYAPVLAAGIGRFLAPTQESRTFKLEMTQSTETTAPERNFNTDFNPQEHDLVYAFIRNWARTVKLNPKPLMPAGMIRRFADDARGLLSVADACGPEWGRRARATLVFLLEKEKAERPEITMLSHGLAIFDALELDQIESTRFNQELKRLDLPDAKWTRYRGPSGTEYAHPIEMYEQAALLEKVDIKSIRCRSPAGKRFRGYKRGQFEEALAKHGPQSPDDAGPARGRLRLIQGSD